jgi:hypothetical protein
MAAVRDRVAHPCLLLIRCACLPAYVCALSVQMSHEHPSILRPQVVLEKAVQLQVYNGQTAQHALLVRVPRLRTLSFRPFAHSLILCRRCGCCRCLFVC